MQRLTDDDKHFGKYITYGKSSWKAFRSVWSSGADDDDDEYGDNPKHKFINRLTIYIFGYVFRILLPRILRPYKEVHTGQYNYTEYFPREYGFCWFEKSLFIYYGPQTHDSTTTKVKLFHPPWLHWRFYAYRMYDIEGNLYYEEFGKTRPNLGKVEHHEEWKRVREIKESCPTVKFLLQDFDGQYVIATTRIEEREWLFGESWCKWLAIFRKPWIKTALDISFNRETGKEKGSWKGGTVGHGIEMLPSETHEEAMRRYCEKEHRSKSGKYQMTFIGLIKDNELATFKGEENVPK